MIVLGSSILGVFEVETRPWIRIVKWLVVRGPYLHVRNPMVTGLLASLLGAGLVLGSWSLVFGLTPLMAVGAWIELKLVEEPELQRRLGAAYSEYRQRVPMFVPRLARRGA